MDGDQNIFFSADKTVGEWGLVCGSDGLPRTAPENWNNSLIYSQCLGCRFSHARRAFKWRLTLCPKRMTLSLWSDRPQREEGHASPFFFFFHSPTGLSSFPGEEWVRGKWWAWDFVPHWEWGHSCDPVQNFSFLKSYCPWFMMSSELWFSPALARQSNRGSQIRQMP